MPKVTKMSSKRSLGGSSGTRSGDTKRHKSRSRTRSSRRPSKTTRERKDARWRKNAIDPRTLPKPVRSESYWQYVAPLRRSSRKSAVNYASLHTGSTSSDSFPDNHVSTKRSRSISANDRAVKRIKEAIAMCTVKPNSGEQGHPKRRSAKSSASKTETDTAEALRMRIAELDIGSRPLPETNDITRLTHKLKLRLASQAPRIVAHLNKSGKYSFKTTFPRVLDVTLKHVTPEQDCRDVMTYRVRRHVIATRNSFVF